MSFRKKQSGGRVYLQIVESRRSGEQVRQQVIATLGRLDELRASAQLERLLHSAARFATQALVLAAARADPPLAVSVRRIGPSSAGTATRRIIARSQADDPRRGLRWRRPARSARKCGPAIPPMSPA
jgi:hypothetical protein